MTGRTARPDPTPQEFLLKKIATAILIAAAASVASADGLKSLESFMKGTQTGKADFTQTVTSPPKDGQTARTKTSSGSFEFQRPGRFKFVYKKPFEQTIVADGQTLWLYDVDLNQVTQRSQSQALGSTPTGKTIKFKVLTLSQEGHTRGKKLQVACVYCNIQMVII